MVPLTPTHLRSLFAATAVLVGSTQCVAQLRPTRLSDREPTTRRLPTNLCAQGAVSVGNRTVLVWGTAEADREGVTRRILRIQAIADDVPLGTSRVVHTELARPTGVLHLFHRSDTVTVLWGDIRLGAPGLYSRAFALDGAPIGDESMILPGIVEDILSYPSFPGLTTAICRGLPPRLLDGWTVIPDRLDSARFAHPHVMRGDSSLVELDSGRLVFWRHFRDSVPERVDSVPVPGAFAFDGWSLGWRPFGGVVVMALRLYAASYPPCLEGGEVVAFHRMEFDSSLIALEALDIDSACACYGLTTMSIVASAERHRLDGGHRVGITFMKYGRRPGEGSEESHTFAVSACGNVSRGERHPTSCRAGERSVTRDLSDTVSSVSVGSVAVSSVIAPIDSGLVDRTPSLFATSGRACASWMRGPLVGTGVWSGRVRLSSWTSDAVTSLDTANAVAGTSESWNNDALWRTVRIASLPRISGTTAFVQATTTTVDYRGSVVHVAGSFESLLGTAGGWVSLERVADTARVSYTEPVCGYDPNTDLTVTSVLSGSSTRRVLIAERSGAVVTRAELSGDAFKPALRAIVPVSATELAFVQPGRLLLARTDGVEVATATINEEPNRECIWAREFGPTFIRASLDAAAGRLHVDRYALDLEAVQSSAFAVPTGARHLSVALDSHDSSLAFLFARLSTIGLIHVDHDLSWKGENSTLVVGTDSVANPVALFDGDQLRIAWEDNRNGSTDILGAVVRGPLTGVEALALIPGALSLSVAPNPARDRLTLVVQGLHSCSRIHVMNPLGLALMSSPVSNGQSMTVDCSGLAPGPYWLVVADGTRRATRPVVVER